MRRIFLIAALALLAAGANADPIVVTIDAVPTNPELGSQVVVNVEVNTNNSVISDYLLFLSFDDTILDYVGTAFNDPFNGLQALFLTQMCLVPLWIFLDFSPFTTSAQISYRSMTSRST